LAWYWVPETRGLSTEVLGELYESGVKPRVFGKAGIEGRVSEEGLGKRAELEKTGAASSESVEK